MFERDKDLDLGDDHSVSFTRWESDRSIPVNAERYKDIPDIPLCGGIITHKKPDGSTCEGSIWFDLPGVKEVFPGHAYWKVESLDPLTLSPSFLCHCGDHGFIKNGKWVRA